MGARFTGFRGWNMPLLYENIIGEHLKVRESAGLFDVSHMGKILIVGRETLELLNKISIRKMSNSIGRAKYTHFVDQGGRIIDDLIITKIDEEQYLCVCNTGVDEKLAKWISAHSRGQKVENVTNNYVLIAIQGPESVKIIQNLTAYSLGSLKRFKADYISYKIAPNTDTHSPPETMGSGARSLGKYLEPNDIPSNQIRSITSRTGYTGEDGFEILTSKPAGKSLWRALLSSGGKRICPVGIGARDTLRLEKGYLLAGEDFDGTQTPLETGHEKLIDWDHEFAGKSALLAKKDKISRRLVGLSCSQERITPRRGMKIFFGNKEMGIVTSGTLSPCLKRGIALGYVEIEHADGGIELELQIRGKREKITTTKLPFV